MLLTAIYLPLPLLTAWAKPLWNDELFTFYISRLPGMGSVWEALKTGAEQIPPLFYVLTRLTTAAGATELTLRLPEVLGFWLMALCLYAYTSRISTRLCGGIAALIPGVTGALFYSTEARPYGIVLGLGSLAMLLWQKTMGSRRTPAIAFLLAVTLIAAVSIHYYAIMLLLPIATGEMSRFLQERKMRWPVWLALTAGGLTPLLYLPLIRAGRTYSRYFWAQPTVTSLRMFFVNLIEPAAMCLIVVFLFAGYRMIRNSAATKTVHPHPVPSLRQPDVIASFTFILIPFAVFVVARVVTGAFTGRYVLLSILGISVILALAAASALKGRPADTLVAIMAVVICCLWAEKIEYGVAVGMAQEREETYSFLRRHAGEMPLVISDPHEFFEFSHYFRGRGLPLTYLADPRLAVRYVETDTVDRGLIQLRDWADLNVLPYQDFLASRKPFLLYAAMQTFGWQLAGLAESGAEMRVLAKDRYAVLYLVTPSGQPATAR